MFNLFYTNCINIFPYSFTEIEKKTENGRKESQGRDWSMMWAKRELMLPKCCKQKPLHQRSNNGVSHLRSSQTYLVISKW